MSAAHRDEQRPMTPAQATAIELLSVGFWPVAITSIHDTSVESPGKAPIGKAWGASRPTAEMLRAVYTANPDAGVGIKLGADGGVIDIEIDDPEQGEQTLLEMFAGQVPATRGWSSSRGPHRLFLWDDRLARYGKTIIKIGGVEIRLGTLDPADPKQIQSVVPPSPAADGSPRVWTGPTSIAAVPSAVIKYLDAAMAGPAPAKPVTIPIYTPRPGQWAAEDRAIAYLSKVDPGVSGSGGSTPAFRAACKIGPGFDLSEDQAVRLLLTHYSPRCAPPWSEKEIRHKVADAFKVESRRGFLLNEERPSPRTSYEGNEVNAGRGGLNTLTSYHSSDEHEDERPATTPNYPKPPESKVWRGPAGEIAQAVEEFTEADPIGILFQNLVGYGCMMGRRAYFRVGSTKHHGNLFVCTAGRSSVARKGTALDIVKDSLRECDNEFVEKRLKSGMSSGEGLIYAVRDQVTKKSPIRQKGRIIDYQDEIIDEGVRDKRLFVTESELGRTLRVMSREGNTLSSIIREAWDSGNLDSLTKGNVNRATNAHVSIVAHVTAEEVTKLLTSVDAANGFANRFLWVAVQKTKSLPDGLPIPFQVIEKQVATMQLAFRSLPDEPFCIKRDTEANKLWHEVYDDLAPDRPGLMGSILGRGQPQTMRLAMVYALLEGSTSIRYEHLEAAIALWHYCVESAEFIFRDALGDRDADRLLFALRSHPEGLSRTAILSGVFRRNKSSDDLDIMLGRLVQGGLARSTKIPTDGRPKTVWVAIQDDAQLTKETK